MRTTLQLVDPLLHRKKPPYTHTGIGGMGNIRRISPPTPPPNNQHHNPLTIITSRASSNLSFSTACFSSGRGGAGNIPPLGSCRAIFSLDEKEDLQGRYRPAPVIYHTARGGKGNKVRRDSSENEYSDSDRKNGRGRGKKEFGYCQGVVETVVKAPQA